MKMICEATEVERLISGLTMFNQQKPREDHRKTIGKP
jgi:hypothetical protein